MKRLLLLLLLFALAQPAPAWGRAAEKMKVYGATFPSSFALYVLDPELLAGWNGPLRAYEKKFIPEKYHNLPILGGWYGKGMIPDREALVRARFDKAFLLMGTHRQSEEALPVLQRLGFDIVALPNVSMADNISMFREMGRAFGVAARGEELAAYGEEAIARIGARLKNLPASERKRIYMAQDVDGLSTTCAGSHRSEVFLLAGGENVHVCPRGMEEDVDIKISFEQILRYDPDVILINHPTFMRQYQRDGKWRSLRAAKEGRVYFVPYEPFSWLDRPASFMRLIGAQWLAQKLHPARFDIDLEKEAGGFLRLFFRLNLTREEIAAILNP